MSEKKQERSPLPYSWKLKPGTIFEIEVQGRDRSDWQRVKVPEGQEVVISGRIRQKGREREGVGTIISVGEGRSFFLEGKLVSPGRRARISFRKGEGKIVQLIL